MSNSIQLKPDKKPQWDLANARKLLKGAIAQAKEKSDQDALSIAKRGLVYAGEKPPSLKLDPLLSAAELTVLAIHMRVKLNLPLRPNVKTALEKVLGDDNLISSLSSKSDATLGGLMVLCPRDVSDYLNDGAVSAVIDARDYLHYR